MGNKKFMIIRSRDFSGLFSNLISTLQYLYLSEVENRIPIIDWKICWYLQKEPYNGVVQNVWDYYFEPVSPYVLTDINRETDDVIEVQKYILDQIYSEPN